MKGGIFTKKERVYIAIDLKSFYASVEAADRGLDPLDTNLVVADESRTDKTICLAVSPSLKSLGIPGRPRLFEVRQKVAAVNASRKYAAPGRKLTGSSASLSELRSDPSAAVDFIIARPRMALYMSTSTKVYDIYLKYFAPEDIIVYSVDEVFMDVTNYLGIYKLSPRELAMKIILDVLGSTGITATAGIGTNLYLAKVAMDIMAKHIPADENGVRIAELDEMSYRERLWDHRPLTDFWRVGPGYSKKLEARGIKTMGDIARCSIDNEELLFNLFGKNAELLIDHAWGVEPCTMDVIKAYRPESTGISSGQVLKTPYEAAKARLVLREMADELSLDLVEKAMVTSRIAVSVGYDAENLNDPVRRKAYTGEVTTDRYGRKVPKGVSGITNIGRNTASSRLITEAAAAAFDRIVDPSLVIRYLSIGANDLRPESEEGIERRGAEQLDLFTDYEAREEAERHESEKLEGEKNIQQAVVGIKRKYGKNAIVKGINLQEGATGMERNSQIGGHKA